MIDSKNITIEFENEKYKNEIGNLYFCKNKM